MGTTYMYGQHAISCMGTGREKPYGGRAEIVRKSCDASAVAVHSADSARKSYGARAGSVRSRCFFFQNDYLKSCDFYKISARPPHDARMMLLRNVYGLRAYDFFSQICHMSSLIKIADATAPMNP